MSRRGNPYDNSLAENFFSILKTECINSVKLKTFYEARLLIDQYIYFYNNQRIQLKTKLESPEPQQHHKKTVRTQLHIIQKVLEVRES